MGKAYANKKKQEDRPIGDFYSTPKSLVWVARSIIEKEFHKNIPILEPCSGLGSISQELKQCGYVVKENDLFYGGVDYLTQNFIESTVITNPPFSLWDNFVEKSKTHAKKILMIGRLNYLGTNSRYLSSIWKNLKSIYCFNRYVDYRTPFRKDGLFNVGAMATGWFLWDLSFTGDTTIHILDVQQYATLGNYKEEH